MGQRSMICNNQMIDLEMDQRAQGYLRHEPCIYLGGITSFPHQEIQPAVAARGGIASLEAHHLHEHYESTMFYGVPQYHAIQHHPRASNVELGAGFYVPYMNSITSGVPINLAQPSQLPSSSSHGVIGVLSDEYEQNGCFFDNGRGSYKRKNAEEVPLNAALAAPSSSSAIPVNARHPDGASGTNGASFAVPTQRMTSTNTSIREGTSRRGIRNRLGGATVDPLMAHGHNNIIQGSYLGQPFPASSSIWYDPHSSLNHADPSPWSQAHSLPYMPGSNISSAIIYSGVPRYHETSSGSRVSAGYVYPSPLNMRYPYVNHPPSALQGVRVHNATMYPQLAAPAPYRAPATYAPQSSAIPPDMEVGPVLPTGFRIYRHRHDGAGSDFNLRHRNLPHLRLMPADEVAVLEFDEFYDAGNHVDHHRDMRLDIEDMSYEELLALSERIGSVNTGLSEETVTRQLKTRRYSTSSAINLEQAPPLDQEPDSCIICQDHYEDQDTIGTLGCGHEFHADCLKKWLFVKNVCPICKSEALASEKKAV